jgi:hypothetical protein
MMADQRCTEFRKGRWNKGQNKQKRIAPPKTDQNGENELSGVNPRSFELYAWSNIPEGAYLFSEFIKPLEESENRNR